MHQDHLRRGLLVRLLRKLPYASIWVPGVVYDSNDPQFERYTHGGIRDYVNENPARMRGVVGLWIANSKALEDIEESDGITVVLEDDFVCRPDFFWCALRMVREFDRAFDVIMFDCHGTGPREIHRIAPKIYQSDGESYPTYWGAHCLFVNNRSISKILKTKLSSPIKDIDGFLLQRDTGLEVFIFYTGKCRQLFLGSRLSGVKLSLALLPVRMITWYLWTRGRFRTLVS